MNLIKDLSDQAKYQVPSGLTTDEWINAYNELLATLIIRECISIVEAQGESLSEDTTYWTDHDIGYKDSTNDSIAMIKERFGIKDV